MKYFLEITQHNICLSLLKGELAITKNEMRLFKANFITGKKLVLLDASRLSQVKYQFCLSKNSQVTKFGAKTSVRRLFDTTLSVLKFTVSSSTQVPRINVLLPSSNNSFLLEYFKRL